MDHLTIIQVSLLVVAVAASFLVSASVGLGGSLLMVPTLVIALGAREGIALAALLLGTNNILKVAAYRRTIPWRAAVLIVVLISTGAFVGAVALVHTPEVVVAVAVFAMFVATFVVERLGLENHGLAFGPLLALTSGATSGFSGTSGPLKGAAIRNLSLDRQHFAGAASIASLAGDLTKSAIFAEANLLGTSSLLVLAAAVPLMVVGTVTGFRLNRRAGERAFAVMFWGVMAGYSARLAYAVL